MTRKHHEELYLIVAGWDQLKLEAVKRLKWFDFYMHLQLYEEKQAKEEQRREKTKK